MLWVLQTGLERGYGRLVVALDRVGCDYLFVKAVPFTGRLLPGDFDSPTSVDPNDVPEPVIDTNRPILTMGSYGLAKIAKARGWSPGAFLDHTDYESWSTGWGSDRMLNPNAWVGCLRDARVKGTAFIRPLTDSKSFSGTVFDEAEFATWQASVRDLEAELSPVHGGTMVLVAAPRAIYTETRFFVIDGKIVTGSLYKIGGRVAFNEDVDPGAEAFARECIASWTPSRAFVVDVALTSDGYRVVEVNCINAAGFYASDLQRLVAAFEDAFPD